MKIITLPKTNPNIDELDFKVALGGGNNYLYFTYKIEAHIYVEK